MVDHFHLSTGLVAARTDLAIAKAQLHEDVTFDATDGRMDLGARMWQAKTRIELGERHVRRLKRELKEARRSVRSVADDLATR